MSIWNGSLLAGIAFLGTAAWLLAHNGVALHGRAGLAAIGGSVAFAAAAAPCPA
jgi:hypothetical protein